MGTFMYNVIVAFPTNYFVEIAELEFARVNHTRVNIYKSLLYYVKYESSNVVKLHKYTKIKAKIT